MKIIKKFRSARLHSIKTQIKSHFMIGFHTEYHSVLHSYPLKSPMSI